MGAGNAISLFKTIDELGTAHAYDDKVLSDDTKVYFTLYIMRS